MRQPKTGIPKVLVQKSSRLGVMQIAETSSLTPEKPQNSTKIHSLLLKFVNYLLFFFSLWVVQGLSATLSFRRMENI